MKQEHSPVYGVYSVFTKKFPELLKEFYNEKELPDEIKKHLNFGFAAFRGSHNEKLPLPKFKAVIKTIIKKLSEQDFSLANVYSKRERQIIRYLSELHKSKPETTFKELFRDPEKADKVKELFRYKDYINDDGEWVGISKNKTELLSAYYSLRELDVLHPGNKTIQAKVFYSEFGFSVPGYISERSLRNEPLTQDREEFDKLFANLKRK